MRVALNDGAPSVEARASGASTVQDAEAIADMFCSYLRAAWHRRSETWTRRKITREVTNADMPVDNCQSSARHDSQKTVRSE